MGREARELREIYLNIFAHYIIQTYPKNFDRPYSTCVKDFTFEINEINKSVKKRLFTGDIGGGVNRISDK